MGVQAIGPLNTFSDLGESNAIINLLVQYRNMPNTQLIPNTIILSPDGYELSCMVRTKIDVQKPELLHEQYGIYELYRITSIKLSLRSNDGYIVCVLGSALETDWYNTTDGIAIQNAITSCTVFDQTQ